MGLVHDYLDLDTRYKQEHGPQTVLLMQVGTFFEVYGITDRGADVQKLSLLLNVQATKKNKSIARVDESNPFLLGFQVTTADRYVKLLIRNGYTVVVYVQAESERVLSRVYTPGTEDEEDTVDDALTVGKRVGCVIQGGAAVIDVYTAKGAVMLSEKSARRFFEVYPVKELLTDGSIDLQLSCVTKPVNVGEFSKLSYQSQVLSKVYASKLSHLFTVMSPIEAVNLERYPGAVMSWSYLLDFVYRMNPLIILKDPPLPSHFRDDETLLLENGASYQLGILEPHGLVSCFSAFCSTAVGKRFLREQLLRPPRNQEEIESRYKRVQEIWDKEQYLRSNLRGVCDIERCRQRLKTGKISESQLHLFYNSLTTLHSLAELNVNESLLTTISSVFSFNNTEHPFVEGVFPEYDATARIFDEKQREMEEFCNKIQRLIAWHDKKLSNDAARLECTERDGWWVTLRPGKWKKIENYVKKEFPQIKASVTNTVVKLFADGDGSVISNLAMCRSNCWIKACEQVSTQVDSALEGLCTNLAKLDFALATAAVAKQFRYTKPVILSDVQNHVNIQQLRHPLIEQYVRDSHAYVPYDIHLDQKGVLLYGINSAGKSSLMKAIGLNIVMAQAGMYVSCDKFEYTIFDTIFTRISGSDNPYRGLSSFTAELEELDCVLRYASPKSIILGDEVCKTTESVSACSIIAAFIDTLHQRKCCFMFASHNHILSNVFEESAQVLHFNVEFTESGVFRSRELLPGPGETVYGTSVARHFIHDAEFLMKMDKYSRYFEGKYCGLVNPKKSRYNPNLYVSECEICGQEANASTRLHTHHVCPQANADLEGFLNGTALHKNSKWNLKVLCERCHQNVHAHS